MKRFVLDASVALAWFLDHPPPPFGHRVRRMLESGSRAVVPALWHLELANAFLVAERRGLFSTADTVEAVGKITKLLGQCIESVSELVSISQVIGTARTFNLSSYDAVYLDLARLQQLPLATLDRGLAAAARQAGVSLVS